MTRRYWAPQLLLLSLVALAALGWHSAHAEEEYPRVYFAGSEQRVDGQYFVEFRARGGPSISGHNFIVYGRLNIDGRIAEAHAAGFYPNSGRYGKALFIPAPGFLGRLKADTAEYPNIVYRRYLTAAEYNQLKAKIRQMRAVHASWHLIFYNCNNFVGEIAKSIGMRRPPSLLLPAMYVSLLRALNGR